MFFDIEASDLNANFGRMLTFGFKFAGDKKVRIVSLRDYISRGIGYHKAERSLLQEMSEVWLSADIVVSWYGEGFDFRFMNSRLLKHGLPPLPRTAHIDLWKTSRYDLHIHSNRLEAASEFFGVNTKTRLNPDKWLAAREGDSSSLKYIEDHNREDVLTLERMYYILRPLIRNHPNINLVNEDRATPKCPSCSSTKLVKEGFRFANTRKYQRFSCKGCGGWSRGRAIGKATEVR